MMDRLKMHSVNIVEDNVKKIGKLFPNCITERLDEDGNLEKVIDFDLLKQELSSTVVDGNEERYQFTWPDKKKSVLLANAPIFKTLRPSRGESVNFDDTENIYIEGDNLDVLKLLRETYLGKIKMIYIDPPYNTGSDLIYADDFSESISSYFEYSGQHDQQGNRVVQNIESNGRFHTDWLNMFLPRLRLAKDLLSEDGAIFISIDDNEVNNAIKVCDEVFGEKNFLLQITNVSNPRGRQTTRLPFALMHEYILVYCKNINDVALFGQQMDSKQLDEYKLEDENGKYRLLGLRKRGTASDRRDRPNLFYPIYYSAESETISTTYFDGSIEILPKKEDSSDGVWRWQKSKVEIDKSQLVVKEVRRKNGNKEYDVFVKDYLNKYGDEERKAKLKSVFYEKKYNNERGTETVKDLFEGNKYFSFPKPVDTIKDLIEFGAHNSDIVLDFFSGSATTAQAVMEINADKGSELKYILVQLPEMIDCEHDAYKAGYSNICSLAEERIRRAGLKIKEENPLLTSKLDCGFRVLKLDSSNMKDVYYNPSDYDVTLFDNLADNIKDDRTSEDLLFQVMLDLGVLLSSKIEESTIVGKKVFNVADGFLIACFDGDINEEVITNIAKQKPYYFVMRDSSLASDSVAANFEQIFVTYSPDTVRKVL